MLQGKAMPVACTGTKLPSWVNVPLGTLVSVVDHTYVKCNQSGQKWGCHGRSSGGATIATGTACNINCGCIANCLYGNDESGVRYLVTGVCHQIANRTLYPASITVKKARGYFASRAIYGEYGYYKAAWNRRINACYNIKEIGIDYNRLKYALLMQRYVFLRYGIDEAEISEMFPNMQTHIPILREFTVNLRINFLNLAIKHLNHEFDTKNLSFQNLVHNDLNSYIKLLSNELGADYVAHLLNLEEYNKNTYILLFGEEFVEES